MADVTMINHYANPAFNAKDEALSFFTKETRDQYRGFSRQLEQMKVIHLLEVRDCVVRYGVVSEGKRIRPLHRVHRFFRRNSEDGRRYGTAEEESHSHIQGPRQSEGGLHFTFVLV